MLLVPNAAPLKHVLLDVVGAARARDEPIAVVENFLPHVTAFGAIGDRDSLDESLDPSIDRSVLQAALVESHVSAPSARALTQALVDREAVLDLGNVSDDWRPPTLFEVGAVKDVLGEELGGLLAVARVRIALRPVQSPDLNHCQMDAAGTAHVRLLTTNGTTLAGRTHALVHELGHALIGVARHDGRAYGAGYGQMDYARFLHPASFERICDEEALVRAMADAWLLRRRAVSWSRTWPGAVDPVARNLDGDDLAAFVRFRLGQGFGLANTPIVVRRLDRG